MSPLSFPSFFLLLSLSLVSLSPTNQPAFLEGTQSICIHEGDQRIDLSGLYGAYVSIENHFPNQFLKLKFVETNLIILTY